MHALQAGLRPRVLLVEDGEHERRLLHDLLEADGVAVVGECADGGEGVDQAIRLEPDVVLMDIRMPGMNGLEAARRLRESLPFTQVIILTSYDGPLPVRTAQEAGVYAYLVKGCSNELMRDVIAQAWRYGAGLKLRAQAPARPVASV